MKVIAVLSPSLRTARIWLEVDHKVRMENERRGVFPNGDTARIFTQVRDLRGVRNIDDMMAGPYVNMTNSEYREMHEMEAMASEILRRNGCGC
jgi:hypothetical protein